MGHACEILVFKENEKKEKIIKECTEWGNRNVDPWEHGGNYDCGGLVPHFKNLIFDTYEEAEDYLEKNSFGEYGQMAVKFRKPINYKQSKSTENLKIKWKKLFDEAYQLKTKVHYKDVKSKTIKCKHCGAVFPTEYCGKTWANTCLVCKNDLRPETVLNKIKELEQKRNDAEAKYKKKENEEKQKSKQEIYWAVACEVHC